ncbi:hypothetical protein G0S15_001365 [Salmonella enterica]|nr:hypothetical protein [Salmonella enterica]
MSDRKFFNGRTGKTPEEMAHKIAIMLAGNHHPKVMSATEYEEKVRKLEVALTSAIKSYIAKYPPFKRPPSF